MFKKALFICVALLFLYVPTASASHYDLLDIDIVPQELAKRLSQDKIDNTERLLALLVPKTGRAEFSKKYGMDANEVETLARKLELMQVIGIGPKAATLLQLAGIQSLKALTEAKPETLLEILIRVNREHNITGVQPDLTVVTDWINKSQKVANHLEI